MPNRASSPTWGGDAGGDGWGRGSNHAKGAGVGGGWGVGGEAVGVGDTREDDELLESLKVLHRAMVVTPLETLAALSTDSAAPPPAPASTPLMGLDVDEGEGDDDEMWAGSEPVSHHGSGVVVGGVEPPSRRRQVFLPSPPFSFDDSSITSTCKDQHPKIGKDYTHLFTDHTNPILK